MKRLVMAALSGAVGIGALLLACRFAPAVGQEEEAKTARQADGGSPENARLIRGYKRWTRANTRPVLMQPAAAAACEAALPRQQASPHLNKFITVYVNAPGKAAMMHDKKPLFPIGTVIVKEKLSRIDSKTPELMTMMVKRATGYNPENGDWEYLVYDGTGRKVTAQGKLEKCQSCHGASPAKETDFVFRDSYLTESQRAALK